MPHSKKKKRRFSSICPPCKKAYEKIAPFLKKLWAYFSWRKCAEYSLYLGIIFSFFQINTVVMQDTVWNGQFNPYTTFQMYLSDLFFLLTILFYGLHTMTHSKRVFLTLGPAQAKLAIGSGFFLVLLSYFFSINQMVTFFWILQLCKFLVVYLIIINRLAPERKLMIVVLWCLVAQVGLGIIQFIMQSSVGLSIIGESHIGPDVLNVAKVDVVGTKIIRPYGTFTHANIFGGLASVGIVLTGFLYMTERLKEKHMYFFVNVLGLGVLLSFSRAAWLATVISIVLLLAFRKFKIDYHNIRKFMFGILGFVFITYVTGAINMIIARLNLMQDASIAERFEQIQTSFAMMINHPLGVGFGNYTNAAGDFSPAKLMPWEFQPVHNLFLLVGNEVGVIAMILLLTAFVASLIALFEKLKGLTGKYRCFPIYFAIIILSHIFILANLDHYFYTNYSAAIFLMVVLGALTNYLMRLEEGGVSLE